ncbi:MAG: phosphohydrolase [Hyphomicrobiales bacterium]|nr:MAG: phosphohydrolase [Hyphomicrobiales bacterium]
MTDNNNTGGPWLQTHSGKAWHILEPRHEDVDWLDITFALAKICRFNGHCTQHYSVAQHSVAVAESLPDECRRYALLHDAHEAYLGDWTRPLKAALDAISPDGALQELESRTACAIHLAAGLAYPVPVDIAEQIKKADIRQLFIERNNIMARPPLDWEGEHLNPTLPYRVKPEIWEDAAQRYFNALVSAGIDAGSVFLPFALNHGGTEGR